MYIDDQIALVTGASSGIGAATAQALARAGAHILLLARRRSALEAVAMQIRASGGQASLYPVDVGDAAAVTAVAAAIQNEIGTPGILINNAGAGRFLAIDETEPQAAEQMMRVPYLAAFTITRAFLPAMLQQGGGHIVNVTSVAGFIPIPGATAYVTARAAMRAFSQALALDLHDTPIGVTLLAAGKVDSPYFGNNPGSETRIPTFTHLFPTLSTAQVAAAIVEAIQQRQREVIIPWQYRVSLWAYRLLPGAVTWLVRRTGWQRPSPPTPLTPSGNTP